MLGISQAHGVPPAVYADRHTIFQSPVKATFEQEIAGRLPGSQFGRLMDELEIELIEARSPQAKGRIERLFGTLQDRLVKELREAGARTLTEANQVLLDYLSRFNARFSVAPREPGSAYRPWPANLVVEDTFCIKHQRTVNGDNTISFSGHTLAIPPDRHRGSYRRARVDVHQRLDGSLAICYQGSTWVVYQPAADPPPRPAPTARPQEPKAPYRPAPDHPWRRYPTSLGHK